MPLPQVFRDELVQLPRRRFRSEAAREEKKLATYRRQQQERGQWCWAAVASSVARFYNPYTQWRTQCQVANEVLGRTDCCDENAPHEINQPFDLYLVLRRTGNLRDYHAGHKSFEDVCADIDAGQPLICRIAWFGGGAHFVVITGYDKAERIVFVADPSAGEFTMPYETLLRAYQGAGEWKEYAETQRGNVSRRPSVERP